MSHYEIDYGSLEGDAKRDRAIQDIVQYLGQERFDKITAAIVKAIASGGVTEDSLHYALLLSGVQGYPVTAWYEHCNKLSLTR